MQVLPSGRPPASIFPALSGREAPKWAAATSPHQKLEKRPTVNPLAGHVEVLRFTVLSLSPVPVVPSYPIAFLVQLPTKRERTNVSSTRRPHQSRFPSGSIAQSPAHQRSPSSYRLPSGLSAASIHRSQICRSPAVCLFSHSTAPHRTTASATTTATAPGAAAFPCWGEIDPLLTMNVGPGVLDLSHLA